MKVIETDMGSEGVGFEISQRKGKRCKDTFSNTHLSQSPPKHDIDAFISISFALSAPPRTQLLMRFMEGGAEIGNGAEIEAGIYCCERDWEWFEDGNAVKNVATDVVKTIINAKLQTFLMNVTS